METPIYLNTDTNIFGNKIINIMEYIEKNNYAIFLCLMDNNEYHLATCKKLKNGFKVIQGERFKTLNEAYEKTQNLLFLGGKLKWKS